MNGKIIKDLSGINRPLEKTLIVDNLAQNFSHQPENGYLIPDFIDSPEDKELFDLEILLKIMVS